VSLVAYEIPDFRKGKQTRKGDPTPTEPFPVTVIGRDEAMAFFNARKPADLYRHLRGLRDLGMLVHTKRRLTQPVRVGGGQRVAAYVVRGPAADVPRLRPRPRVRNW
jgi:hypothetical protein